MWLVWNGNHWVKHLASQEQDISWVACQMQSPWRHPQGVGHVIRTQVPDLPSGPWQDCGIIKYSIGSKVKQNNYKTLQVDSAGVKMKECLRTKQTRRQKKQLMSWQTVSLSRFSCSGSVLHLSGHKPFWLDKLKLTKKCAEQLLLGVHYAARSLFPNITRAGLSTDWWQGIQHQSAFFGEVCAPGNPRLRLLMGPLHGSIPSPLLPRGCIQSLAVLTSCWPGYS